MGIETEDNNLKAVTQNMSEINPDVIEQQKKELPKQTEFKPAQAKAPRLADSSSKDRLGRTFDPSLHQVDAEGRPRLNRDGLLAQRVGRHGKTAQIRSERQIGGEDLKEDAAPAAAAKNAAQTHNMARMSSAFFINTGVGLFGDEWYPMKGKIPNTDFVVDEEAEMVGAFHDYFQAKGITDIPAGWALVMALSGYAAARLMKPKTQSKFKVIMEKATGFAIQSFIKLKSFFKKAFKGVQSATHIDSRGNGERQDNAGPKVGEGLQS